MGFGILVLLPQHTFGAAFGMTSFASEWMYGEWGRSDQDLIVPSPGQELLWFAAVWGALGTCWCTWRWIVRVRRKDPAAPMKTWLTAWPWAGQVGGLVGTALLIGGGGQSQAFQSTSQTAWEMVWGQGILLGECDLTLSRLRLLH